jgi:N-acetylglucosamine malate deacetylase 1
LTRAAAAAKLFPMTVLIVSCHPDDAEFMMTGTALLLKRAGCAVHYINVANGSAGSSTMDLRQAAEVRRKEARSAAALLGAVFHESLVEDLEVFYEQDLIRRVTALVRQVKPDILLTMSLEDYMEDHMNTARVAVTAAFLRGVKNYRSIPPEAAVLTDVMVYHATPHILTDSMRRPIIPEMYVDVSEVMPEKERMLACHASQQEWLDASQGFDSYLGTMRDAARAVGKMSGRFQFAEGWRRHSHVGFSRRDGNPVMDLLGSRCLAG